MPLEFLPGETPESLGLNGHETFAIDGVTTLTPRVKLTVHAKEDGGKEKTFQAIARVDTPEEVAYYKNGGILQYVLRNLVAA